jgi:hypothetical protein
VSRGYHPDGRDLTVLVPMLGRPHTVAPLHATITVTVPAAQTLWILSSGDVEVVRAVAAIGGATIVVPYRPVGDYGGKINAGYLGSTRPLLFTGACDLAFHPGWYQAAVAQLKPGIGVVGTNDLGSPRVIRGEHATHFLIARSYADQHGTVDGPGAVMAEVYPHEYVDDELVGTAKARRAWAMAIDSHVEHLHPDWGKGRMDGLYLAQRARMRKGRPIYQARRRLWET